MEELQDSLRCEPAADGTEEGAPVAAKPSSPDGLALSQRRLGFLKGQLTVPDDINTMFAEEIEELFYGPEALHKFDGLAKDATNAASRS